MAHRGNSKGPSQRQLRAGELVRRVLVEILARGDLRDPDLQGVSITVTEVRTSPDLKHATVFCAPLTGTADNLDMKAVIKALTRSGSYLRGQLGKQMETKFTPRLSFQPDMTFDTASDMNALLSQPEVRRDLDRFNRSEEE